jgi:hypothetical protein
LIFNVYFETGLSGSSEFCWEIFLGDSYSSKCTKNGEKKESVRKGENVLWRNEGRERENEMMVKIFLKKKNYFN